MTEAKQKGSIELEENLGFQRKMWVAQRVTWVVMLALFVIIALGFTGAAGPFNASSVSNGVIQVGYQPFTHRIVQTNLDVRLQRLDKSSDTAQVVVSRDYMNHFQVLKITPEPDSVATDTQHLIYTFNKPNGATKMDIAFQLQTGMYAFGSYKGVMGPNLESLVKFNQVILP